MLTKNFLHSMNKKDFRIIFMGTPDFAVESLRKLIEKDFNVVAVVTNPDKPAGRGQKIKESAVKKMAKKNNLPVIQPESLKSEQFKEELESYKPHLQIVVAFKILPPNIFTLPEYGTFNLHASLLPQYRGAAPINHAILNGEKETGVTTFLLDNKVDTGKVIDQKKVPVDENDDAGTLHDKLMYKGAELVIETAEAILNNNYTLTNQKDLIKENEVIKKAPKIYKENCRINWYKKGKEVYNFIRGLSPYPAAWTIISDKIKDIQIKIFKGKFEKRTHNYYPGMILSDNQSYIKIAVMDGFIKIDELQAEGKKRMKADEFLRGFREIEKFWCKSDNS